MEILTTVKLAGTTIVAVGAALTMSLGGWDYIHSDYETIEESEIKHDEIIRQQKADNLKSDIRYSEIRMKEYDAVDRKKRDGTWHGRRAVHETNLENLCDELTELGETHRKCK